VSDSLIQLGGAPRPRLPEWARKSRTHFQSLNKLKGGLRQLNLHTVCESARCPNIHECFHRGAATFMILGSHCMRGCGFCSVPKFNPARREMPLDSAEPANVARMAADMKLRYVVITSVNRDDLPDGGSAHFAETVRQVRSALPDARVEVLTPDFCGDLAAVARVLDAGPHVFNHNMETVPRLYTRVRPQADYRQSLDVLAFARRHSAALTKSGFMVGLGETEDEVRSLLRDLHSVGTDAATEMINCFSFKCERISRTTSATTCGFTQRKTISAPFTASELSVPACTFNLSFSIRARSACAAVAQVCPGDSNPSRKKDCSRIDPIFPAPRIATFFLPTLCAIGFSNLAMNIVQNIVHQTNTTMPGQPPLCSSVPLW